MRVDPVAPQVGLSVVAAVMACCVTLLSLARRQRGARGRREAGAGARAEREGRQLWMLRAGVTVTEALVEAYGPIDLRSPLDLRPPDEPARDATPDPTRPARPGTAPDARP